MCDKPEEVVSSYSSILSAVDLANTITKTKSIAKMKKRVGQTKTEVAKVLQKVAAPSTTTKCYNISLTCHGRLHIFN
jgi:hypothetical protein